VTKADFFLLLDKYLSAQASPDEEQQLLNFYESFHEEGEWDENTMDLQPQLENRMRVRLLTAARAKPPAGGKVRPLWSKLAVAVSVLACLIAGAWLLLKPARPALPVVAKTLDVAPGHKRATLTLANGKKILLTQQLKGQLAQQGNMSIRIDSGNTVAYVPTGSREQRQPVTYNTLTTQKGEASPYPLVLADGTKIWLDAASSITFPTAFDGNERVAKMTGQAYFKVAHNTRQPFKVMVNGQIVEDLGTEFNINAYNDEAYTRTTLLEGSIRVHRGDQQALLVPGQQAIVNTGVAAAPIKVSAADTEQATAWLNGKFQFNNDDLATIMRSISRWYDVKVVFKDGVSDKHYLGRISRDVPISQVFQILKSSGINFTIEGNQIIVTN